MFKPIILIIITTYDAKYETLSYRLCHPYYRRYLQENLPVCEEENKQSQGPDHCPRFPDVRVAR